MEDLVTISANLGSEEDPLIVRMGITTQANSLMKEILENEPKLVNNERWNKMYILNEKYPTFQSKSIPLTNLNGTTPFIKNDKYVYKTGDYN